MRFSSTAAALAGAAFLPSVLGYPGMDKLLGELQDKAKRQDCCDSTELIGDLITLSDSQLSPVGHLVKNIIVGNASGESNEDYYNVPLLNTASCAADTCCIWQYIANTMEASFRGASGRCTNAARAAVRLGFHDAAGWSKSTGPLGGADGSIVLAPSEILRPKNNGLQEIIQQMQIWYNQYHGYGVSMADLIQFGATVATVVCPLGPRIHSFVGRYDSSIPAPDGLLPGPFDSADFLIDLFRDKTIQPHGLTALLGAHSTSQQRFVDTSRAGDPQDGTPGVWDVLYYKQTLGPKPPRVFTFQSDINLSEDPRIYPEFAAFAGPGGQQHWNEDYAREYVRLSLLGVYNINNLTDCTKTLPNAITTYVAADQWIVDLWVGTTIHLQAVADALLNGSLITNLLSLILGILLKVKRTVVETVATGSA
ncbi:peroxidase [Bombardia bombarda]|uniref:Peroxidase n=1 Tax=Bombardia bombarda TaxID=252184 RepID=A0AA39X0E6_9PEZI|nr:peroxidase [Bombardia bombarda]